MITATVLLTALAVCSKTPTPESVSKASVAESVPETNTTDEAELSDSGILTDKRDGRKYRTVEIFGKRWMAENLNYRTDSSWCYKNADSNCAKYGRLYNWTAAMNACPAGWYLPSRSEWSRLSDSIDSTGKRLKTKSGWKDDGNGTDEYGFSALPGGSRNSAGEFRGGGFGGWWWTSTEGIGRDDDGAKRWARVDIRNFAFRMNIDPRYYGLHYDTEGPAKSHGNSVRCVQGGGAENRGKALDSARLARRMDEEKKQKEAEERAKETKQRIENISTYFTDSRDGRKYRAVTIGGKTWMAENLNHKTGVSWCYDNDTSYCGKYGRLYNWETAKKACPAGWHLPKHHEWDSLASAVGGKPEREKVGIWWYGADDKLKSTSGWDDFQGINGYGDDAYGFSALPGGYRGYRYSSDNFKDVTINGLWWTATEYYRDSPYVWRTMLHGSIMALQDTDKRDGVSVRCVRNGK
jgi:uncharacterized protein (TIGR02145 family)